MNKEKSHKSIAAYIGVRMVRIYQICISPFIGGCNACRFTPSCSEYTRIAITRYGFVHGTVMGIRRILRCRPGGGCGYDPVP